MPHPTDQLEQYAKLVREYADTLDLSSPAMLEEFEHAIEQSAHYETALEPGFRVLDLGSGVGLPGIPMAIRRPDCQYCLCEVRKRRAAFLELTVATLRLTHVRVYTGDVRQLRPPSIGLEAFHVVTAQAVGSFEHVHKLVKHALTPSWTLISRKGEHWAIEVDALKRHTTVIEATAHKLEFGTHVVSVKGGA